MVTPAMAAPHLSGGFPLDDEVERVLAVFRSNWLRGVPGPLVVVAAGLLLLVVPNLLLLLLDLQHHPMPAPSVRPWPLQPRPPLIYPGLFPWVMRWRGCWLSYEVNGFAESSRTR